MNVFSNCQSWRIWLKMDGSIFPRKRLSTKFCIATYPFIFLDKDKYYESKSARGRGGDDFQLVNTTWASDGDFTHPTVLERYK